MAITKLMHIKERKQGNKAKGLYNAINYICNPLKTDGGNLINSNCGYNVEGIYNGMMDTKQRYNKLSGRQGYHFVVSFAPYVKISDEMMMNIMDDFIKELFDSEYDFVYAVHNDTDHPHGHVVFNSVSRKDGYKYRYEKGDWEKIIQPITNKICKKYNLPELEIGSEEEINNTHTKSNKKYKEKLQKEDKRDELKEIIDKAIRLSNNYESFLDKLFSEYGIEVKEYYSKNYGNTIKFKGIDFAGGKYIRSSSLGFGYSYDDIIRRINNNGKRKAGIDITYRDIEENLNDNINKFKINSSYIKWSEMSDFQKEKARKAYMATKSFNRSNDRKLLKTWEINRSMESLKKMTNEISTLKKYDINTYEDAQKVVDEIEEKLEYNKDKKKELEKEFSKYIKGGKKHPSMFELLNEYKEIINKDRITAKDLTRKERIEDLIDLQEVSDRYKEYTYKKENLRKERYNLYKEETIIESAFKEDKERNKALVMDKDRRMLK